MAWIKILILLTKTTHLLFTENFEKQVEGNILLTPEESIHTRYFAISSLKENVDYFSTKVFYPYYLFNILQIDSDSLCSNIVQEGDLDSATTVISKTIANNSFGDINKKIIVKRLSPEKQVKFATLFTSGKTINSAVIERGFSSKNDTEDELKSYLAKFFPKSEIKTFDVHINQAIVEIEFILVSWSNERVDKLFGNIWINIFFNLENTTKEASKVSNFPLNSRIQKINPNMAKNNRFASGCKEDVNKIYSLMRFSLLRKVQITVDGSDKNKKKITWTLLKRYYNDDKSLYQPFYKAILTYISVYGKKTQNGELLFDRTIEWQGLLDFKCEGFSSSYSLLDDYFNLSNPEKDYSENVTVSGGETITSKRNRYLIVIVISAGVIGLSFLCFRNKKSNFYRHHMRFHKLD